MSILLITGSHLILQSERLFRWLCGASFDWGCRGITRWKGFIVFFHMSVGNIILTSWSKIQTHFLLKGSRHKSLSHRAHEELLCDFHKNDLPMCRLQWKMPTLEIVLNTGPFPGLGQSTAPLFLNDMVCGTCSLMTLTMGTALKREIEDSAVLAAPAIKIVRGVAWAQSSFSFPS